MESVIFDWVRTSYDAYQSDKIRKVQFLTLGSVWKGVDFGSLGWKSASRDLDPAIRGPLAYFLARKALPNHTDEARAFLKTAEKDAGKDSPLSRLVQAELTKLKPGYSVRSFDISADGKEILFDRIRENSDIVLIDRAR